MWVGLFIGFIIGAAAEAWGIANPETLIRLAKWEDRLFVACITLGLAISTPVLYGLYAAGVGFHFSPKPLYVIGVGIGGLLFGAGLAISGYFPGSIWMALGEGRRDAVYAVFGAILGAATWTVLYQTPAGQWLVNTLNFGSLVLGGKHVDTFIIQPFSGLTPIDLFGISIVYAIAMFLVAYYTPRYKGGARSCLRENIERRSTPIEIQKHMDTARYLTDGGLPYNDKSIAKKMNEYYATESNVTRWFMVSVAGIVGLTVVLEMFLHQIFGESTTDSWIAGQLFLPNFKYSQIVFKGIGWEPFSDIGTLMGAFFSAVFLTRRFTSFRNIIPPSWAMRFGNNEAIRFLGSFGGAYLMLFGARMADGCASGHILSGDLQMAISGLEFTAAVFAAMLITAHFVYRKR
ncbi:YeeE/YedE thiosulfate transporter family protein [Acidianus manzaensis]|uniref:Transporter n=1 Tax=Acidianus manzaensis TaxID=282676 RepID=A0A1W6K2F3_9CREN|nr:YeeE/YedE thiosulfate transporter family protein [Acidianus manzaensis]ARM76667.1 transporter [Acidianus manzaensis]